MTCNLVHPRSRRHLPGILRMQDDTARPGGSRLIPVLEKLLDWKQKHHRRNQRRCELLPALALQQQKGQKLTPSHISETASPRCVCACLSNLARHTYTLQ